MADCVKCGYCCTKSICPFGEWDKKKFRCKHLGKANEYGQRECIIYEFIIKYCEGWEVSPAFGSECSSALFNNVRDNVINKLDRM